MVAPPPASFTQREPFSESEEGPDEHLLSPDILDTLVPAPSVERSVSLPPALPEELLPPCAEPLSDSP
eukprot:6919575-Alexandrium_andersonii.AAC.1